VALRKPEKIEVLSALALFEHCTKKDLAALATVSVDESFPPGAVLTREGQLGGLAYVLLAGSATARRRGRKLATLGAGAVVGELSLIDGGPRTATVTADEALEVLAINADDFRRLVVHSPRFTVALLRTLAGRIRDADRRGDLRH
jgi:CRP/FNR family cyclic AMP-dependent transcriptional regulator